MNLALIGYGSMGFAVRRIAEERGHNIAAVIDPRAPEATAPSLKEGVFSGADVALDFSLGEAVLDNIKFCREAGVDLVIGTTGWYDKLAEARDSAEGIGLLWSSNFSIGVNLYFKIVEEAAKLMDNFDEYDIWGHEIHHYNKTDSPSGTAKTLEKILLDNIKRKKSAVEDKLDRKRADEEIHFSSVRGGAVNFAHTVGFDSAADRILLTHEARNRDGYALGAIKAAEWLKGKKGFFEMKDFLNL
ncbi:MAG: 4-hydroxy-tetrahydrodipicolinate reductase [Candidatus Spechtbacteria bacterium]|nr:4-hydroxy-tetrahydrodipicolinate reductase [Candidatus Spechtbacteria bacterium]